MTAVSSPSGTGFPSTRGASGISLSIRSISRLRCQAGAACRVETISGSEYSGTTHLFDGHFRLRGGRQRSLHHQMRLALDRDLLADGTPAETPEKPHVLE